MRRPATGDRRAALLLLALAVRIVGVRLKSGRSSSLDQSPLLHARERESGEMTIGFSESSQLRGPSQSRCLFFAQERAATEDGHFYSSCRGRPWNWYGVCVFPEIVRSSAEQRRINPTTSTRYLITLSREDAIPLPFTPLILLWGWKRDVSRPHLV